MWSGSLVLSLLQNTALLLSFSMLYDFLWTKEEGSKIWLQEIVSGFVIGGIGIVLMMSPWTFSTGMVFDTRSVLLSVSGLFFGALPTVIAMVIDAAYRFSIGGEGVWMGMSVIISSGTIGILWRNLRPGWRKKNPALELLALGLLVHLIMLGCTLLLPESKIVPTINSIALPLFFIYSPGTMLLGMFMLKQSNNRLNKKALNETKALYISLVEHMPAGVFRKSLDGRYEYVNARFCSLKGLTEEEILGKTPLELGNLEDEKESQWTSVFHPRQRTLVSEGTSHHEIIVRTGNPIEVEEAYPQKDGSVDYFQVIKTPIFDFEGKVIGSQGMQFDITSFKRTEEALRYEQYLLDSFMNNTVDLIYFKDIKSRFIRVNRALNETFHIGITQEAFGKTDFDFFTEEHAQKALNDEQNIIKTGVPIINLEEKETWVDGRITWASTSKFPLIDEEGKIIGTFGVSRDITLQKQLSAELIAAKEQAEEGDHLKTAFLHNISHEIRTPMNAIVGFAGFLNDPDLTPDKRTHFADIIVQSSNQLLSIIDDIVRISTIEAGQEKILEGKVNINSMCMLAFAQFESKASESGIDFKNQLALPDHQSLIISDETKLSQVLMNLLVNAFKFTKGGHIYFGYTLKENELEFYVEDTGIGIPAELHEEIFKRFRQVESTLSRQFGGSGLGLSICQAYIHLMGGKMWVTSSPGSGSVFYFTIPYRQTTVKKESVLSSLVESDKDNDHEPKPLTILVAEDEDFNYMLLREWLAPFNATIIRAINGLDALELATANKGINLVLMDLKMPIMDGYESTKEIKKIRPALPILALTAYSQDSDKRKALECGCIDFISKPFSKENLIAKIKAHLSQS